jgi:hypothetical protein
LRWHDASPHERFKLMTDIFLMVSIPGMPMRGTLGELSGFSFLPDIKKKTDVDGFPPSQATTTRSPAEATTSRSTAA